MDNPIVLVLSSIQQIGSALKTIRIFDVRNFSRILVARLGGVIHDGHIGQNDAKGTIMIDNGIAIPKEGLARKSNASKYPWRHCEEVGDSFFTTEKFGTVQTALKKFCYRNKDISFFAKEVDGGVRVWRTK